MHASIFSKLPPEKITALHQSWKNDPLSVDPLWAAWFEGYELGSGEAPGKKENTGTDADTSLYTVPPESAEGTIAERDAILSLLRTVGNLDRREAEQIGRAHV